MVTSECIICIQALNILQINWNHISNETIKKSYRKMCRQYHPDQYQGIEEKQLDAIRQKYNQIQNAYHFLSKCKQEQILEYINEYKIQNVTLNRNQANHATKNVVRREARIFSSNKEAARLNKLQKEYKAAQKKDSTFVRKKTTPNFQSQIFENQGYEDALRKISTIWIAELIHRKIEEDKKTKEKEHRDKLYRAFMQYQQNQNDVTN